MIHNLMNNGEFSLVTFNYSRTLLAQLVIYNCSSDLVEA